MIIIEIFVIFLNPQFDEPLIIRLLLVLVMLIIRLLLVLVMLIME